MIKIRKSEDRGHINMGWLDTRHTFSFGDYHDPAHVNFRHLRVINDDIVAPGQGFGMHEHRDMEIITYVIEGQLEHKDSLGHGAVIRPGEVQRMSAGRGIAHSEFNPSRTEAVRLLQIWIFPEKRGLDPSWDQKEFPIAKRRNRLGLLASPDEADGSLKVHQDVRLYAATLDAGAEVSHALDPQRYAWVQVARGGVELNGQQLSEGDGAAVSGETRLTIRSKDGAEFLLFDLS
ncbi:MAG: pirin family protein [Phycisphaerales bacterium]|nr:pirin family protein [Phycisphaerales bacterium]